MPTVIIIVLLVVGLAFIATEGINKMNKAAVAMFMGTVCWLIYIGFGTDFVVAHHQVDFLSYLSDVGLIPGAVKTFIASHIFLRHVAAAAEIVLFLLATITIVEVLQSNGCFDFLTVWLRTRSPRRYLIILASVTFIISANLDNLTTTCLVLAVMHTMIADERQRMILGAVIVVAANCGGAFTVIGDVTGLLLWSTGRVTPTAYALTVLPACLAALITVVLLAAHSLKDRRLALTRTVPPYRGDDTVLTVPQRLLMLLVGIGGLWFIPTFHRITLLPPFVGALCVLALLWIVNEICNRKLLASDRMISGGPRRPMSLQYAGLQHILYIVGLVLAFAALQETGALSTALRWGAERLGDSPTLVATSMGGLSAIFGNTPMLLANTTAVTQDWVQTYPTLAADSSYWGLLSFSTALGGSLLGIGTMAGYAFMRTEGVSVRWYIRHMAGKVLAGWAVGLIVFRLTAWAIE